ncbi:MAG: phytanoyl-CoA dioxygenase family protein [Candidatus Sericytochromatia bacterium]
MNYKNNLQLYQDFFNKNGYLIIKNFFIDNELELLENFINKIYKIWLKENQKAYENNSLVNMSSLTDKKYFLDNEFERVDFFNILTPKKLINLVNDIFNEKLYFHNTQLFFNPYNRNKKPYWHRDLQFSDIEDSLQEKEQLNMISLHIRIPFLNEIGIELISGSHKRWDTELEKKVRFDLDNNKNSDFLPNSTLINLTRNDVLIFEAQMIHRGNYELNNERKALDICIGKKHFMTKKFIDNKVFPDLIELEKISNNEWYKNSLL